MAVAWWWWLVLASVLTGPVLGFLIGSALRRNHMGDETDEPGGPIEPGP